MVNIIDRRKQALGGQSYGRSESSITGIAWHYTGVARERGAFITGHENFWRNNRGWRRGGYHYYIDVDGKVYQNYDLTTISNGVAGHNSKVVNISVEANSANDYSKAQEDARRDLTLFLMKRLNLSASAVKQHGEFSGQSTSCAGYTKAQMDKFRKELIGGNTPSNKSSTSQKSTNNPTIAVDGFWGKGTTRALQRALGTTVDGVISGQYPNNTTRQIYSASFTSRIGSNVIRALQRKIGVKVDGYIGPDTVRALQRYLGTHVDGVISKPSLMVKEMQRRLNNNTF